MSLLKTIFSKPKIIFLSSIIAIIMIFLVSLIMFNDYVATARIVVITGMRDKEIDIATEQQMSVRAVKTTAASIKNQQIIKEVVKELNLEEAFGQRDATAELLSMISARPVRGTDIIEVSVKSKKKELAAHIANAICKELVLESTKRKFSFERDMLAWLSEQASVLRKEVETAAEDLRSFEKNTKSGDIKKEYDSIRFRIKNLRTNIAALSGEIQEAETAYNNMQRQLDLGKNREELLEVKSDDSYRELEAEHLVVKKDIEILSSTYQQNHPDVVDKTKKLKAAEELMVARIDTIINNISENNQILKSRKEDLEQMIKTETEKLGSLEKDLDKHNSLLNALREKDSLYAAFMKKTEEDFGSGIKVYNVDMLEQAYLPENTNRPAFSLILILGLICGVTIGGVYNATVYDKSPDKKKKETPSFKGKGMYIERVQEKQE